MRIFPTQGGRLLTRARRLRGIEFVAACALAACTGVIGDPSEQGATGAGPRADSSGPGGNSPNSPNQPGVFAPAPGAFRRLTSSAFRNSLGVLLKGPVDIGDLEPDSWSVGGLASIGAAAVSISPLGVEQYESAIDAATTQVFADKARRDKLLGCAPKNATDSACFEEFVTTFGRLAFRQALTTAQVTRYTQLITSVAGTVGDVYEGMRAGMTGLLLSPNFLYRLERGAPSASGSGFWQYTSSEMATRLSYFLTNSTPDATLLDLVDKDGLQTAEAVRSQAQRLLATETGRESIGNFASELFQLNIIASRAKDAIMFPEYTPTLQAGMAREIPAMLEALVFDRNASALDLFTTRNTFVTKELASLYGLPTTGLSSTTLTPVTLPGDGIRVGLLGTAAFLSLYASQKEGSPTQRGKFIRQMLLCQKIPPPPANVVPVLQDPPPGVVLTKREKLLTLHETQPTCAACHSLMDPPGLSLENFDAIGKFRTTDQGKLIDASGNLDGATFNGPVELGKSLASKPETATCLVQNLYQYGTGHIETDSERPVLADLSTRFQSGGYHLRDLMLDIVSSDGFRYVAAPTQ